MRNPLVAALVTLAAACATTTGGTTTTATTTVASPTVTVPRESSTTTTIAGTTTSGGEGHDGELRLEISAQPGQSIRGWGFGIAMEAPGIEPLAGGEMPFQVRQRAWELLVDQAGVNLVRVFSPGFGSGDTFEEVNDNADATDIDLDAMALSPTGGRLTAMSELGSRGVRFLLTGGAAPSWMRLGSTLRPEMAAEYAEHLVAYALHAGEVTGIGFDWITAANEPDNPAMEVQMGPQTSAAVLEALAGLADRYLPSVRLVVGDTVGWSGAGEYLDAAIAAETDRVIALAAHSYGSLRPRAAVAERALEGGLEVWMTEKAAGGGNDCTGDDPGMTSALEWADWIAGDLREGRTSVWLALRGVAHVCHDPQGGLLVYDPDQGRLTIPKRYYAFRHYSRAGTPGSVALPADWVGPAPPLRAVAFDRGESVAVVVPNPQAYPLTFELVVPWRDAALTEMRVTDGGSDDAPAATPPMVGGRSELTLPSRSITTLIVSR